MLIVVVSCVVNGPSESKPANICISLPGRGESLMMPVFVDIPSPIMPKSDKIAAGSQKFVDDYVCSRYYAYV
ncbi:MAG: hypothetical protein ACRESE_01780 [Gammaproteobacteria bacterium]